MLTVNVENPCPCADTVALEDIAPGDTFYGTIGETTAFFAKSSGTAGKIINLSDLTVMNSSHTEAKVIRYVDLMLSEGF
jgi:hypothetical protein